MKLIDSILVNGVSVFVVLTFCGSVIVVLELLKLFLNEGVS